MILAHEILGHVLRALHSQLLEDLGEQVDRLVLRNHIQAELPGCMVWLRWLLSLHLLCEFIIRAVSFLTVATVLLPVSPVPRLCVGLRLLLLHKAVLDRKVIAVGLPRPKLEHWSRLTIQGPSRVASYARRLSHPLEGLKLLEVELAVLVDLRAVLIG